jgi:hypothetical protein
VLISYESVHATRKRKKGKSYVSVVKLNMMKTYDRVEWNYQQAIMLQFGFNANFVQFPTRVNLANVLNEGLRIGEIGRWMNSKVKLVETGVYRK